MMQMRWSLFVDAVDEMDEVDFPLSCFLDNMMGQNKCKKGR